LFWLELRWFRAGWCWRELGSEGETRGVRRTTGTHPPGWYLLEVGDRVRLGAVWFELTDALPPETFAVDTVTHEVLSGDDLSEVLVQESDGLWPANWELDPAAVALRDCAVFATGGRVVRAHIGVPPKVTDGRWISLTAPTCQLELRVEDAGPTLEAWDGTVTVKVRGAHLWVLAPYFEARIHDVPLGGWLRILDAFLRWKELVVGSSSGHERIGQDRNRTVQALGRGGVQHADHLFERRREGRIWEVRAGPDPERLAIAI